jgi:hypothetical protein
MQAIKLVEKSDMADNGQAERPRKHGRLVVDAPKTGRKSFPPPSREGRRLAAVFLTPEKLKDFKREINEDDTSIQAFLEDIIDIYIASKAQSSSKEAEILWRLASFALPKEKIQALKECLNSEGLSFSDGLHDIVSNYIKQRDEKIR